jgi:hypothetical protein
MRWTGHVAFRGERRVAYSVLVWKPEGKRPLRKPRCKWEECIKIDLQEVGSGGMHWVVLAQNRGRWRALVNVLMNFRGP